MLDFKRQTLIEIFLPSNRLTKYAHHIVFLLHDIHWLRRTVRHSSAFLDAQHSKCSRLVAAPTSLVQLCSPREQKIGRCLGVVGRDIEFRHASGLQCDSLEVFALAQAIEGPAQVLWLVHGLQYNVAEILGGASNAGDEGGNLEHAHEGIVFTIQYWNSLVMDFAAGF